LNWTFGKGHAKRKKERVNTLGKKKSGVLNKKRTECSRHGGGNRSTTAHAPTNKQTDKKRQ